MSTDLTDERLAAVVEAGLAYLDDHYVDWWHEIDLSRLDMGSGDDCVMGQMGGAFITFWRDLSRGDDRGRAGTQRWMVAHGFMAPTCHNNGAWYGRLTSRWRWAIEARRAWGTEKGGRSISSTSARPSAPRGSVRLSTTAGGRGRTARSVPAWSSTGRGGGRA